MAQREAHLLQADRNERFLSRIDSPEQPYGEWVIVGRFYVCLQYVDAFLATKEQRQIAGHPDRFAKMMHYDETKAIFEDYEQLYKESTEARYYCTQYTREEVRQLEPLYLKVRNHLRRALGLE